MAKLFYPPSSGYRFAYFSSILAFAVITLGAYTRLTDAGLGCPDWPSCYGQWLPNQVDNSAIHLGKAWTEMIHRYLAGALGLCVFTLAIRLLMQRQHIWLPIMLSILILFQALLGMWTVTLKLFPLIVMAHLLGGMATLALLWCLTLSLQPRNPFATPPTAKFKGLRVLGIFSIVTLVLQLFLGGWTSANYAALVCPNFPNCHDQFIHSFDLTQAFNLLSAGVDGSQGQPLTNAARTTIHMVHRIGALLTTLILSWFAIATFLRTPMQKTSLLLIAFLFTQVFLGITNVLAVLPLFVAVAHNAISALLLTTLITINYKLYRK